MRTHKAIGCYDIPGKFEELGIRYVNLVQILRKVDRSAALKAIDESRNEDGSELMGIPLVWFELSGDTIGLWPIPSGEFDLLRLK